MAGVGGGAVLAPLVKAFGSLDGDLVWVHGAAVALVTSMLADGSADADAMALLVAHTGTLSDTEGMRPTDRSSTFVLPSVDLRPLVL